MTDEPRRREAEKQEDRSVRAADHLRAVLLALATGGIVGDDHLASRLGDYWKLAAILCVFSLTCLVISWFLVKHRALARREAAVAANAPPDFRFFTRSWTWDIAGAAWLALAVVVIAIGLA